MKLAIVALVCGQIWSLKTVKCSWKSPWKSLNLIFTILCEHCFLWEGILGRSPLVVCRWAWFPLAPLSRCNYLHCPTRYGTITVGFLMKGGGVPCSPSRLLRNLEDWRRDDHSATERLRIEMDGASFPDKHETCFSQGEMKGGMDWYLTTSIK